jgi:hypothetical protein
MNAQETVTITRDRVGRLGSYFGGVALLVAILALIWTGLSTLTLLAFAFAAIGIVTWAIFAPRDFRDFISGRQARFGLVAFLSTLLLIGIVAMSFLYVRQRVITFDMTQSSAYTLSPETLEVLRRVNRPIQITGFYTSRTLPAREVDDQFFRLYEVATDGLITRRYLDPEEVPAIAQRFGVVQDGDLFLSYVAEDGSADVSALSRVFRSGGQERDMTEAIMRLLLAGSVTVYFDESHGARAALDGSQVGLSGIHNGMQESGLVTNGLSITTIAEANDDIPIDARAVILPRPLTDFSESEVAVLDRYLKRGGALLIMTDVVFTQDAFLRESGVLNSYLWANYGIRALDAAIVDPGASTQTPLDILSYAVVANTVTPRLNPETAPAVFSLARALEVTVASPQPTVANGRFIMTSELSYAERNLELLGSTNTYTYDEGVDTPGPLTVAAWAEDLQTGARIVLVGDSDFASNGQVVLSDGNGILVTDAITWLTSIEDEVTFAPVAIGIGLPLVAMDGATTQILTFTVVVLIPLAVLIVGIAIWARRSRA